MTDTTPEALRALADTLAKKQMRVHDLSGVGYVDDPDCVEAAATLRKLADEKEAARDARREALEEAAARAHEAWMDGVPVAEIPAAIRALINDTGPSIADELAQARDFIKDYQRQLSEEMVRSSVAEAKLAKVQGALDDLAIRLGDPQRRYDKIGPTWTGKSGHEYSDMSELLDFATEIGEQTAAIRALIDREPEPVVGDGKPALIEKIEEARAYVVHWYNERDVDGQSGAECIIALGDALAMLGAAAPTPTEPTR